METMPLRRILLVSLLAGVTGVNGGPAPGGNANQKPSSRSSIAFPYDDYTQFTSLGTSYYGGGGGGPGPGPGPGPSHYATESLFSGGSGNGYSSGPGIGPGPGTSGPGGSTRQYIFPQEDIIMGSGASHSPFIYYADPPPTKGISYTEYTPGYRTPTYGSPKTVFARDSYKQSSAPSYESAIPPNYGLHPAVASNINRLRLSSGKPILYSQLRERERSRIHPSPSAPGYLFLPPYKKMHWSKYPVKEIPNPDVINNALISSPFKSKYYKQKIPFPLSQEDPESQNLYEDQQPKRTKKRPHSAQMELNFEIQPSIELDLEGGILGGRGKHTKNAYDHYSADNHQTVDIKSPQSDYYKYTNDQDKPYKTSYDSDKEFYGKQQMKKPKLKAAVHRPSSYDDSSVGYNKYRDSEAYDGGGQRYQDNYETNYKLEHPSDSDQYYQSQQNDDDYNGGGPVNPFADDSDGGRKYAGATSYVSITKPRVIGFKTLRGDRESANAASEQLELQRTSTDSDELSREESPILSYKPASSSVSNWTPINPPAGGGVVPAKSYNIPAPNLSQNKRAGIVTDDSIENYNAHIKMIEDAQPIIGRPYKSDTGIYKSSDTNINKLDNSEGVVSAVMFFKQ